MNQKLSSLILLASTLTLMTGCESDSGGKRTGVFIDSPVANLAYTTQSTSSYTDGSGQFKYVPGETITFKIGDIVFPSTAAQSLITPFEIFGTENVKNKGVINLARFLQTLDVDANPDNGIVISDLAHTAAAGYSIDFSSPTFDDDVVNLVANSGSVNVELVSVETALAHMIVSLDLPDYYGESTYACKKLVELEEGEVEDNDSGRKTCGLVVAADEDLNRVVVTFTDDEVSHDFEGTIQDYLLTFSGDFPEEGYSVSASLQFDLEYETFTGRITGVATDGVPFDNEIKDGKLTYGSFFSIK